MNVEPAKTSESNELEGYERDQARIEFEERQLVANVLFLENSIEYIEIQKKATESQSEYTRAIKRATWIIAIAIVLNLGLTFYLGTKSQSQQSAQPTQSIQLKGADTLYPKTNHAPRDSVSTP